MKYPNIPKFIARVEKYCEKAGILETSLCKYALGNQVFMNSVRTLGMINIASINKVDAYMLANPPQKRAKQGRPKKVVEEAALPE